MTNETEHKDYIRGLEATAEMLRYDAADVCEHRWRDVGCRNLALRPGDVGFAWTGYSCAKCSHVIGDRYSSRTTRTALPKFGRP